MSASLEATVCARCGRLHAPARKWRCLGCGHATLNPSTVELRGTVETFTELKAAPGSTYRVGLAIVRLDAGPMVTGQLRINGIAPEVGGRVVGSVEVQEGVQRIAFTVLPLLADVPPPQKQSEEAR